MEVQTDSSRALSDMAEGKAGPKRRTSAKLVRIQVLLLKVEQNQAVL